jgi:hypothetical protein
MKSSFHFIKTIIGVLIILIFISGKLSAQSEILGHTYAGSLNGHVYYVSDCTTTWQQANDAALQMGGYLVTIGSDEENEFISDFAPPVSHDDLSGIYSIYDGAWTGLLATVNNGTCGFSQWINGESFVYFNWTSSNADPTYITCGSTLVVGICSSGWCGSEFSFTWFTSSYDIDVRQYILEFNGDPGCNSSNKSYVCHNGNTICVNNDAVQAHINHGDYAGPCGPCNAYALQTLPDETSAIEDRIHQPVKVPLSEHYEDADSAQDLMQPDQIQIFPNPASGEIHVEWPGANQEGTLRILSLTGQEIQFQHLHSKHSITIDISTYPPGFYLVDIRNDNGHYQKKFVKL